MPTRTPRSVGLSARSAEFAASPSRNTAKQHPGGGGDACRSYRANASSAAATARAAAFATPRAAAPSVTRRLAATSRALASSSRRASRVPRPSLGTTTAWTLPGYRASRAAWRAAGRSVTRRGRRLKRMVTAATVDASSAPAAYRSRTRVRRRDRRRGARGDGDGGRSATHQRWGSVGRWWTWCARRRSHHRRRPSRSRGDGDREEEDARDGDDRDGDEEEALHDEVVARVRAATRRQLLAGRAPHRPELAPTTVAAR